MASQREINREIYALVGETCPEVDVALHEAEERIKAKTSELREGMYMLAERAIDAERMVEDLLERIEELERDISDLKDQLYEV